jgi:hypothetical protein
LAFISFFISDAGKQLFFYFFFSGHLFEVCQDFSYFYFNEVILSQAQVIPCMQVQHDKVPRCLFTVANLRLLYESQTLTLLTSNKEILYYFLPDI